METEYLDLEISRKEIAAIFVKVPKGWRPNGRNDEIKKIAEKVQDFYWENYGWENSLECEGYKTADESEIKGFDVIDLTE